MSAYDFGSGQVTTLDPTRTVTTTGNQAGVDVSAYIGDVAVMLDATAGTGTTPSNTVKLQDSPDNSTFTDVVGGAFAGLTTVASQQKLNINADALNKYVRVVDTIAGTTPSYTRSVTLIGRKQVFP